MKPEWKHLELPALLATVYSIVSLVLELEFAETGEGAAFFRWSECAVAVFFTVEYVARWVASRSLLYPLRWMAVVDLLAVLPFYFGFLVDLRTLRLLRVVRVVRVLKLYRYTSALDSLVGAFNRVRYEIGVVGFALLTIACVSSVVLYELERDAQPQTFAHLSDAGWYTIVTLTTVGYGDKVPVTSAGKLTATLLMLVGLGLFGTFISLIGSAFLEELRNPHRWHNAGQGAADELDTAAILKSLDAGEYHRRGERGADELAQLLARACRLLEDQKTRPPGSSAASPLG